MPSMQKWSPIRSSFSFEAQSPIIFFHARVSYTSTKMPAAGWSRYISWWIASQKASECHTKASRRSLIGKCRIDSRGLPCMHILVEWDRSNWRERLNYLRVKSWPSTERARIAFLPFVPSIIVAFQASIVAHNTHASLQKITSKQSNKVLIPTKIGTYRNKQKYKIPLLSKFDHSLWCLLAILPQHEVYLQVVEWHLKWLPTVCRLCSFATADFAEYGKQDFWVCSAFFLLIWVQLLRVLNWQSRQVTTSSNFDTTQVSWTVIGCNVKKINNSHNLIGQIIETLTSYIHTRFIIG